MSCKNGGCAGMSTLDNFSKKIMKTCGLMNRKGNTINIQEGQDKKLHLSTTTILEEMLTS
jgi:hypothetical protein